MNCQFWKLSMALGVATVAAGIVLADGPLLQKQATIFGSDGSPLVAFGEGKCPLGQTDNCAGSGCGDSFQFFSTPNDKLWQMTFTGSDASAENPNCALTVCYELENLTDGVGVISHFGLDVCDELRDHLVSVTFDGTPMPNPDFGFDGSTGTCGFKIEDGATGEYCFTFAPPGPNLGWVLECTTVTLKDAASHATDCITGLTCGFCEMGNGDDNGGAHGCTPGYWKTPGLPHWPDPYTPDTTLAAAGFIQPACNGFGINFNTTTLLDALNFGGGPGITGAARNLLRSAVAGLLNAQATANDPDCWNPPYPVSAAAIISSANSALATCDRNQVIALHEQTDDDNNAENGCPINAHGECTAHSCDDNCGGQASGGCWCDEACCDFADCCEDKFDECGGCDPNGPPPPPLVGCEGACGGQSPEGCWCDEACCDLLDCCDNKFDECGGCDPNAPPPPPVGCEGFCGGPSPEGCWCDESCCALIDCCDNKFDECGGCDPNAQPSNCCSSQCIPSCGGAGNPTGCDDASCEALICGQDPFCCNTGWDTLCADAANAQCPVCQ